MTYTAWFVTMFCTLVVGWYLRDLFYSVEYFLKYGHWPRTYLDLDTIYDLKCTAQKYQSKIESFDEQKTLYEKLLQQYKQQINEVTAEKEEFEKLMTEQLKRRG